jgi:hypothetical protein
MSIISKTQFAILVASLIMLGVLGGCTAPPKRYVVTEPPNPYNTSLKIPPVQGVQVLSGQPNPLMMLTMYKG